MLWPVLVDLHCSEILAFTYKQFVFKKGKKLWMKTMVKYRIATGIGGSTGACFEIPKHNDKYIWL